MIVYKKSLSRAILLALEKTVDGYVRFEDFIYNPGFYVYSSGRELKKSELGQALKRLREGGLIESVKDQNKIIFKLTTLGRESIINHEILNKPWDGKWRIVIFDIPESHRRIRNLFRRNLKFWDFKIFQKSVWITKLDVKNELKKVIKDLGIEKWVVVIESDDPSLDNIT